MKQENEWPEDKADWPHAVGAVQSGLVPIGQQTAAERLVKLQEQRDELLKQRDELLEALQLLLSEQDARAEDDIWLHKKARAAIRNVKGCEK